jgi:translation elongation factor EF-Tu-like GTPase
MNWFVIEGHIRFLSTEEGGRKGGFIHGYRPNISFGAGQNTDCMFLLDDNQWVLPGEESNFQMVLMTPPHVEKHLAEKSLFIIREGARIVGEGFITQIIGYQARQAA